MKFEGKIPKNECLYTVCKFVYIYSLLQNLITKLLIMLLEKKIDLITKNNEPVIHINLVNIFLFLFFIVDNSFL